MYSQSETRVSNYYDSRSVSLVRHGPMKKIFIQKLVFLRKKTCNYTGKCWRNYAAREA